MAERVPDIYTFPDIPDSAPTVVHAAMEDAAGQIAAKRSTEQELNLRFGRIVNEDRRFKLELKRALEAIARVVNEFSSLSPTLQFDQILAASYYGGASAPEATIDSDLAGLAARGFNNVRVWASWAWPDTGLDQATYSPLKTDGSVNTTYMNRLKYLLGKAATFGIEVDVSLSGAKFDSFAAHLQGVKNLVDAIKDEGNYLLDLANEHNVGDERFRSPNQMRVLIEAVQERDAGRRVMGSIAGTTSAMIDFYNQEAQNGVDYDLYAPHFPRDENWNNEAQARVEQMKAGLVALRGIYLQEESLRGEADTDSADDFFEAAVGAKKAVAAGWCFHTRAGFDLRTQTFFDQLDTIETEVVDNIASKLAATTV